jgi:hypothetical protein
MTTYYPIEFLPENPDLGDPKTRNFFRNNLPFQPSTESAVDENSVANFGKQTTFLESSINNNPNINQNQNVVTKEKSLLPNKETNNLSNSSKTNKSQNRYTRINIDSRLRNIQPKHILDTKLNNLTNALYFTKNSNSIIVNHPNHGYSVEDKIIIEFATSLQVKIKGGLIFEKGSTFAKINQPNHGMINGNIYTIQISNVTGDIGSGTYLINYPVNIINKTHQVYFTRSLTDEFDPNNYYIQLDIVSEAQFTYLYSFNVTYLNIKSIPLNQINADYPISPDRINGFQVIDTIINSNFYSFSVNSNSDSSTLSESINYNSTTPLLTGDGGKIMVIKVLSTISGYPDNNNYQIILQRNFYHVTQIKLINTIFPITQKLINNTPISIQNNLFFWQNLADGETIYSISVPSGNYNLNDLQIKLTSLINNVVRPNIDSSVLVNDVYTYNTNYCVVNINQNQNTFSIQFFQRVILSNSIFKDSSVYPDGFSRATVTYKNHGLIVGNIITFSNVIGTDGIPSVNLNGNFAIETVIDINTFLIRLDRFNSDSSIVNTNGGTAINLLIPIQSRLLFNVPNTIGNVLGFNNVGDSNSVTSYSYIINNYDLYEVDILENSVGVITQPRQDTRILNVNPNNYILMLVDVPFNDQINLFNTSTYAMAKIYLSGDLNSYVYDQYIQLGSTFQESISTLSTLTFSFYGPDNNLYDFNNVEHSFTIEIVEQLGELVIESYNLT